MGASIFEAPIFFFRAEQEGLGQTISCVSQLIWMMGKL